MSVSASPLAIGRPGTVGLAWRGEASLNSLFVPRSGAPRPIAGLLELFDCHLRPVTTRSPSFSYGQTCPVEQWDTQHTHQMVSGAYIKRSFCARQTLLILTSLGCTGTLRAEPHVETVQCQCQGLLGGTLHPMAPQTIFPGEPSLQKHHRRCSSLDRC